jgi:hypothetical protein
MNNKEICKNCKEILVKEVIYGGFGPHKGKEVCKHCGKWIRWVKYKK